MLRRRGCSPGRGLGVLHAAESGGSGMCCAALKLQAAARGHWLELRPASGGERRLARRRRPGDVWKRCITGALLTVLACSLRPAHVQRADAACPVTPFLFSGHSRTAKGGERKRRQLLRSAKLHACFLAMGGRAEVQQRPLGLSAPGTDPKKQAMNAQLKAILQQGNGSKTGQRTRCLRRCVCGSGYDAHPEGSEQRLSQIVCRPHRRTPQTPVRSAPRLSVRSTAQASKRHATARPHPHQKTHHSVTHTAHDRQPPTSPPDRPPQSQPPSHPQHARNRRSGQAAGKLPPEERQ